MQVIGSRLFLFPTSTTEHLCLGVVAVKRTAQHHRAVGSVCLLDGCDTAAFTTLPCFMFHCQCVVQNMAHYHRICWATDDCGEIGISILMVALQELGGEQPGPEFPGPPGADRDRDRGGRGRPGLGLHDRDREGRDRGPPGSDPCHLYVGYIAAHVTDQMLEGLFRRWV
jgi:hypothetical protein